MPQLKPAFYAAIIILFTPLMLSACSTSSSNKTEKSTAAAEITCPENRPLICTRDYRPVCGKSTSGRLRTYSNGCTACSNPDIVSYVEGECPKDK